MAQKRFDAWNLKAVQITVNVVELKEKLILILMDSRMGIHNSASAV